MFNKRVTHSGLQLLAVLYILASAYSNRLWAPRSNSSSSSVYSLSIFLWSLFRIFAFIVLCTTCSYKGFPIIGTILFSGLVFNFLGDITVITLLILEVLQLRIAH